MRPQVGNVIHNKYRLLRLIGDGGMGAVFEARHEVLGTTVALKFLHVELSRRPGLVQRFLQEARVSAQIQSPNVVRVTDVDQTPNGLAFIVMELLDGKTLQALYEELYRAGQRLSYADALEYAIQMLEGVAAAHKTGIVHRDLKPDNVMITHNARGEVVIKLLDFGIAKLKVTGQFDRGLTRPGVIMGTPEYMAPEQAYSADAVDSRADIFSLAVITFEMLAGRRPVGGDEPQQIASAYLSGQVSDLCDLFPDCPAELADAIHKAMAPLAKDRFPSVDAFRAAIEPFWLAIRSPSSVHTSHPSLSFSRLTPIPSMRPDAGEARHATGEPPRADMDGRATGDKAKPAVSDAPPSPKPAPVEAASTPPTQKEPVAPAGRANAPASSSMPTSAAMPVVPDLMVLREPRAPRAGLTPVPPPRVAKTLPPEDEDEDAAPAARAGSAPLAPAAPRPSVPAQSPQSARGVGGIDGGRTAEGEPPVDSQVPSREPTPLGGFYPYDTGDVIPSTAPEGAVPPPGSQPAIVRTPGAPLRMSAMASAPTAPMPRVDGPRIGPVDDKAADARPFAASAPIAVAVAKAAFEPPAPPPPRDASKAGTVKMAVVGGPDNAPPVAAASALPELLPERPRAIAGTRAASLLGSAAPGAGGAMTGPSAVNGSGTAEAAPLFVAAGLGAGTAEAAPLFVNAARASENASAAASPDPRRGPSKSSEANAVAGDRTAAGGAPPIGGATAQGSGLAPNDGSAAAGPAANAAQPPPPRAARKARRAAPLALVVLLAGGVSAAVVGGVYVAHRSASVEDHNDDPIVMPTPTAVHADPQPGAADPSPTAPVPSGAPGKNVIKTQPTHPGGGPHPPLPPGYLPPPHPPGSAKPPDQPPGMPPSLPIIIPSGFPFPFPGPPPGPPPQQPQPDPSGRPRRGGGLPPLEPIPRPPQGPPDQAPER